MLIIPIADSYAQIVSVTLAGQACTLNLYQKAIGFYCDLYVGGTLIIGGVRCLNRNRIVRNLYFGFAGDLVFTDTQGTRNPSSPGLGTRFQLVYLELSDLGGIG